MLEILSTLITVVIYIFIGVCALFLVGFGVCLFLERFTSLRPIEWLIDKAMRSH